jgi:hypothetical protein
MINPLLDQMAKALPRERNLKRSERKKGALIIGKAAKSWRKKTIQQKKLTLLCKSRK